MARRRKNPHPLEMMFDEIEARRLMAAAAPTSEPKPAETPSIGPLAVPRTPKPRVSKAKPATVVTVANATKAAWYGRLSKSKTGLNVGSWSRGQTEMRDSMFARHPHLEGTEMYLDDGVSGAAFNDLEERDRCYAAAVRGEFEVLFCEDVDRLGRDFIDVSLFAAKLKKVGVIIITYRHGQPESMLFALLAAMAQHEREKTSQRVRDTRPRHIAKGRVLGICPYGYEADANDKLIEYKPEADVVRFIFHTYATTFVGADQICRNLEELGIPAPNGGTRWWPSQLLGNMIHYEDGPERMQGILCRRAYIGERVTSIVSTRRDSDGNMEVRYRPKDEQKINPCPRIVDQDTWDRVQKRLSELQYGHRTVRYLLSDLIECGVCNGRMILSGANETAAGPWGVSRRIRCRASFAGECAHTASYDVAALQAGTMRVLNENLYDPRLTSHYNDGVTGARAEPLGDPAALKNEIERVTQILGNLARHKATASGDLNDVYDSEIAKANARRFEIQKSLTRLENALQQTSHVSREKALDAVAYFIKKEIPHDLTTMTDKKQIEAVQRFRELFVRLAISPVPESRSCFAFRCETVFGAHIGVALVRFQNISSSQALVIERLRNRHAGLRMRDITAAKEGGASVAKDTVYGLVKYGIAERCTGRDDRPRFRLAVKVPLRTPTRFARFEIKMEGCSPESYFEFLSRSAEEEEHEVDGPMGERIAA